MLEFKYWIRDFVGISVHVMAILSSLSEMANASEFDMGWKIFAIVFFVLTLLSATHEHSWTNLREFLDLIMSIPAALGLLLFAFKLELFSKSFWWAFSRSYSVYSLIVIMTIVPGLYRQYGEGKSLAIVLGALLLIGGLQVAASVGLWLYALKRRPAIQALGLRRVP